MPGGVFTLGGTAGALGLASLIEGTLSAEVPAVEFWGHYERNNLLLTLPSVSASILADDLGGGILDIVLPRPITLDTRDNILRLYEIPPFFSQFREGPVNLPLSTPAPAVSMEGEVYSPIEGELSAELPAVTGYFHYSAGLNIEIPSVEALLEGVKSISRFEVPAIRLSMVGYTVEEFLYEALVLNTKNMALSRYDSLPFQYVFELGGKIYGCGPNGLYEVTGDTDGGSGIEATIKFPELDIRKEFVKHLSHAFLTMRGKGTMKVTDGSNTYSYSIREVSDLDEVRVKFGKGLRARFLGIEINNKDGSNIEIDTLSIFADREDRRRR